MAKTPDTTETFYAKNRDEWRDWLAKNHATTTGIWLIMVKKDSGKPCVAYDESVEEALCFGWIDSHKRGIDAEKSIQLFTPRKPKSMWSASNKQRVERLIADGLMTPAGLEKIEQAKQNGAWTQYDEAESLTIPADLASALATNETARVNFEAFSNSSRKLILRWIYSAKRPETRANRIEETVTMAAQNIKAHH
jgi:uncharacterized protein YdeI (YjbR/CyaY-like superfamily)